MGIWFLHQNESVLETKILIIRELWNNHCNTSIIDCDQDNVNIYSKPVVFKH